MDRTIAIRIEDSLHKRKKMRLAENGMTLKDYIVGLIGNDLKESKPLIFENISLDNMISEESVQEAQKVLDFVQNIIISQEGQHDKV